MGAAIVGPRIGRFDEAGLSVPIRGHTITVGTYEWTPPNIKLTVICSRQMSALGVFILFFGFFAFNLTALPNLANKGTDVAMGRIAVSTAMSGCTGALSALVFERLLSREKARQWSLLTALKGCMTGLVRSPPIC